MKESRRRFAPTLRRSFAALTNCSGRWLNPHAENEKGGRFATALDKFQTRYGASLRSALVPRVESRIALGIRSAGHSFCRTCSEISLAALLALPFPSIRIECVRALAARLLFAAHFANANPFPGRKPPREDERRMLLRVAIAKRHTKRSDISCPRRKTARP